MYLHQSLLKNIELSTFTYTEQCIVKFFAYILVSVVEFHDGALGIGKVFGQESTVVK